MATITSKNDLTIVRTEHPNATVLREGFAAFGRGDLDVVRGLLTDDCSWTSAGAGPLAGTYQGWTQIEKLFGSLFTITDGTLSMQIISCLADDTHSIAIYDMTSTIKGVTETQRMVMTQELTSDGRAANVHVLAYDQAAADAHAGR